jgi:hypothetical protein
MNEAAAYEGAVCAVYSRDGVLLASNSPVPVGELRSSDYILYSASSNSLGWELYSYFPRSVYRERSLYLWLYSGLSLFLAVAFCILIIAYALRRTTTPRTYLP